MQRVEDETIQKFGKIYIITNKINNKVYIGQTIQSLERRFICHACHSNKSRSDYMYIKRAIHKYGKENFTISLLEECPVDKLNQREEYWIKKYNSFKNGYNLTIGGDHSSNYEEKKLENNIDINAFKDFIIQNKPLAIEVAKKFNICKCSVYNLIKRLNDPRLVLNSYNPRKAKTIDDIDKQELINLYKAGYKIKDLVSKYHIKKNLISAYLKSQGIKIRRKYRI